MGHQRVQNHVKILKRKLKERMNRYPGYSLRKFAQSVNHDASALTRILTGQDDLTLKQAVEVVRRLEMSHDERVEFLSSVGQGRIEAILKALAGVLQSPLSLRAEARPGALGSAFGVDAFSKLEIERVAPVLLCEFAILRGLQ